VVTALYRRYRPETFAELIGQSQVTDPLRTALRTDRVNHAYLFSGPRGCGKTTSARILARCLNCAEGPTDTPCGVCPSCVELSRDGSGSLDVVEIDAASHNGVDDARDLRERAVFAPARDRYKIFILDEAHMVTPQGFNALLKIVEEPPEHVKFIFATTEPEKVIGTIRSRTHHYPFRLVPPAQMLEYVQHLCAEESITVAPGVLPLVVRAGGGSVRDTLSLLDQLMAGSEGTNIEYERAVALLGYTHGALLDEVVDSIGARDAAAAFTAVDRIIQTGQDPRRFVEDLLERLRDLIIVAATGDGAAAVLRGIPQDELERMTQQARKFGAAELSRGADVVNAALTEMTGATSPRLHLELMIARVLVPASDESERGSLARVERLERRIGLDGPDVPVRLGGDSEQPSPRIERSTAPPARTEAPASGRGVYANAPAPSARGGAGAPSAPVRGSAAGTSAAPAAGTEMPAAASPAASSPVTPAPGGVAWPVAALPGSGAGKPPVSASAGAPAGGAATTSGAASTGEPVGDVANDEPETPAASAPVMAPGTASGAASATPVEVETGTSVASGAASSPEAPVAPDAAVAAGAPAAPAGSVAELVEQTSRATVPPVEPEASTPPAPVTTPLPVTLQQVRDSWPEILDLVEKEKRSAWMVVFPAQARAIAGDVLTLTFPNEKDVAEFRQPPVAGEGVSEHLRRAILDVLGIRVKFIAKVEATMANTAPAKAPGAAPVAAPAVAPAASTSARTSAPQQQRPPQAAPAVSRPPQGQQTQQAQPSQQGQAGQQGQPGQQSRPASQAPAGQSRPAPQSAPQSASQSAPQSAAQAPTRGRPAGAPERKLSDLPDSFAPPPDDYVEPIESDLEPVTEPLVSRGSRPPASGRPTGAPSGRPTGAPAGRPTGAPASNPPGRPTGAPASNAPGRPTGAPASNAGRPTGAPANKAPGRPAASPAEAPATDASGWAVASIPGAPTPAATAATEAAAKPAKPNLVIDPTAAPTRPFGRPAAPPVPGEVQRYGESVVREVLGATFIEEEPVAPRVIPMPRND
jgi:DNA polymerase-3 subunit gamma/tau